MGPPWQGLYKTQTIGAYKSELAGRIMAEPVILKMK